jgi:hypothetical protein
LYNFLESMLVNTLLDIFIGAHESDEVESVANVNPVEIFLDCGQHFLN